MVVAPEAVVERDVGDAVVLPELGLVAPRGGLADRRGPDLEADRGRVAPGFLGQGAQLGELGARLVARRKSEHDPAVAPAGDAPQGVDTGVVDGVPGALEADMRLGPQRLHQAHLLLRAFAAIRKIFVEADELDLVPADADAEPEAAAAQDVERGGLLGDQHGLALRQDQDLGREADRLGAAGEVAEQHEGIVEQILRGVAVLVLRPVGGVDPEHVVGQRQMVVAELLRRLGELARGVGLAADIDQGQRDAELHGNLRCCINRAVYSAAVVSARRTASGSWAITRR